MFFGECTVNYPVEHKLCAPLTGTHEVYWIHTGPEYMGWSHKRTRMFCCGWNLKKMKYVGPPDYKAAFADRFYTMTQMTGDVLLCGPEEQTYQHYVALAKGQGHDISVEYARSTPFKQLLPLMVAPSYVQIFDEHCKNKEKAQTVGGTYIGDLHHHPGARGSTPGGDFPSQLCHGLITSFRDDGSADVFMGLVLSNGSPHPNKYCSRPKTEQ